MIIDHFNTDLIGGAAVAALRLHQGLLDNGIKSRFWYRPNKDYEEYENIARRLGNVQAVPWSGQKQRGVLWVSSLLRKCRLKWNYKLAMKNRPPGLDVFSSPLVEPKSAWDAGSWGTDVMHLHWVSWMINYPSFFASIPDTLPILWTLHDMNPFTGGCHFSYGCDTFAIGCGNCPQLGKPHTQDFSRRAFEVKSKALRHKNLHIIAPSRWMEGQARRSAMFRVARSIQCLYHGLDVNCFAPMPKEEARRALGLDGEGLFLCFGAATVDDPRKGLADVLRALASLRNRGAVQLLLFGKGRPQLPSLPNVRYHSFGYLKSLEQQRIILSAADLFLMPSAAESLGQTALEALACETPVLAYDAGALPEFVMEGRTGFLCPKGDWQSLAGVIAQVTPGSDAHVSMAKQGRELILREFNASVQIKKYIALYDSLRASGQRGQGANAA